MEKENVKGKEVNGTMVETAGQNVKKAQVVTEKKNGAKGKSTKGTAICKIREAVAGMQGFFAKRKSPNRKWVSRILMLLLGVLIAVGAYFGVKQIIKHRNEAKSYVSSTVECYNEPSSGPIEYDGGKYNIVNPNTHHSIVKGVDWYASDKNRSSIILFAKDGKRGFCNIVTDEVIVAPTTYTKAWIFSEGLAAVEKDGMIGFVNTEGELVIPCKYSYRGNSLSQFVFHDGYCVVADSSNKIGAIDTKGQWVVKPRYDAVELTKDYAIVYVKGDFKKQIDYKGNVLQDGIVDDINNIYYEVTYTDVATGAPEEGRVKNSEYSQYSVGSYVGLISKNGEFITPPIYTCISGVSPTVFCATLQDGYSKVLIDKNGKVISRRK